MRMVEITLPNGMKTTVSEEVAAELNQLRENYGNDAKWKAANDKRSAELKAREAELNQMYQTLKPIADFLQTNPQQGGQQPQFPQQPQPQFQQNPYFPPQATPPGYPYVQPNPNTFTPPPPDALLDVDPVLARHITALQSELANTRAQMAAQIQQTQQILQSVAQETQPLLASYKAHTARTQREEFLNNREAQIRQIATQYGVNPEVLLARTMMNELRSGQPTDLEEMAKTIANTPPQRMAPGTPGQPAGQRVPHPPLAPAQGAPPTILEPEGDFGTVQEETEANMQFLEGAAGAEGAGPELL